MTGPPPVTLIAGAVASIACASCIAALSASFDLQPCVHAELLVRVLADGAIHLVGPGLEGKRQRGPCARLDDLGLLLDSLPLNFERVWDAARVHDGERHYAGSDTAFREFDFPLRECGGYRHWMGLARERNGGKHRAREVSERNSKHVRHTGSSSGKSVFTACSMPETMIHASLFPRE